MNFKEQLLAIAAETNQAIPQYESLLKEQIDDLKLEFADQQMLKPGDMAPFFPYLRPLINKYH